MSEPASLNRCPDCGAALPQNSPEGLCPKCLLVGAAAPTDAGHRGPRPAAPPIEAVAAAFPQLEVIELVGQGGMGCVFKARQPQLNRFVALKILPEAFARDAAFARRFTREAQALAALSHPNIVTIHDFGRANGFFFLLMEFVDGVNLRQALRAGRFTPEQALAIVPPICDALQYAHERGIVHRDIKPENLLLDRAGRVKIADFGIAKMLGANQSDPDASTVQQTAAGTPQYMAPEQRSNPQRADHRADIYSLGMVLYELLTGELPGRRLQPPSTRVQIDVRLDEVVLRALEHEPEMRYATAAEFRTQVVSAAAVAAGNTTPGSQVAAREPWLAAAISLVLLFAGLILGILFVDAVPVNKDSAYFLVCASMFCAAPVGGILINRTIQRHLSSVDAGANASASAWLKALGWAAFVLAIPAIGFGGFFFLGLIGERGRWNPDLSEGVLVPLTWLGAVLLPLAGRKLLRAAASKVALHESGWRHSSPWPRFIAASLLSVVAVGVALVITYLGMRRSHLEREAALRARAEAVLAESRARQSKREQFVPREGMANQTSWSVHPKPSFLNSNGWAVMARMTVGGVARIQLPGEAGRRCDITLLKGDDTGIAVRIDDLVRNSAMTLSLRRDQPGEITLDGAGYRVLFPTTEVAASEPGISHFAHVIVTEAGEQKELSLDVDLPGQPVRDAPPTIESPRPTVDSVPPVVVQTEPASGARDVTPGPTEIRVRFSKRMDTASWSWVAAWTNSVPKIIERPRYEVDSRTCVLKVDLDPGKTYAYWLNSSSHQNFKDSGARPAVPYLLIFRTRSAGNSVDGSPSKPAAREPSTPNTP